MRRHEQYKKILVIALFAIAAIMILVIASVTQESRTSETQAESFCECTDDDVCYPDGCTRKPKTDDNEFSESRYDKVCNQFLPGWPPSEEYQRYFCGERQPDCCSDMVKYQDSRLCCFMERWHCHPSYCDQLQGDDRSCGKYWGLQGFDEYGCVKRGADGEAVPKYGVASNIPGSAPPTNTPAPPTDTPVPPTQKPTSTNTPIPTTTPQPESNTQTRVNTPTDRPPTATPTQPQEDGSLPQAGSPFVNDTDSNDQTTQPQQKDDQRRDDANNSSKTTVARRFNVPSFNLQLPQAEDLSPKKVLQKTIKPETVAKLNRNTEKPLAVAEDTFVTVKSYDQQLEEAVEGWLFKLRIRIQKLFR